MRYDRLLDGKFAVVTSGATGMGKAIATLFARHGAQLAICGTRQEAGDETVALLHELGATKSFFLRTDMGVKQEVDAFCDEILARFGKADVLVNNVGVNTRQFVADITEEIYQRLQDVDVNSMRWMSQRLLPGMIEQKDGNIISISTIHARASMSGMGSYATAKGGMHALTRLIALENAQHNVRANVVAPGGVWTSYVDNRWEKMSEEDKTAFWAREQLSHPHYGPGHADDIANACLFLASEMASYITGFDLMVEGGAQYQTHQIPDFPKPEDYDRLVAAYAERFSN